MSNVQNPMFTDCQISNLKFQICNLKVFVAIVLLTSATFVAIATRCRAAEMMSRC